MPTEDIAVSILGEVLGYILAAATRSVGLTGRLRTRVCSPSWCSDWVLPETRWLLLPPCWFIEGVQTVAIESVMTQTSIFVFSPGNFNIFD